MQMSPTEWEAKKISLKPYGTIRMQPVNTVYRMMNPAILQLQTSCTRGDGNGSKPGVPSQVQELVISPANGHFTMDLDPSMLAKL